MSDLFRERQDALYRFSPYVQPKVLEPLPFAHSRPCIHQNKIVQMLHNSDRPPVPSRELDSARQPTWSWAHEFHYGPDTTNVFDKGPSFLAVRPKTGCYYLLHGFRRRHPSSPCGQAQTHPRVPYFLEWHSGKGSVRLRYLYKRLADRLLARSQVQSTGK